MSLPEVSFADSSWVSLHPHVAQGGAGGTRASPDLVTSVVALWP